MKSVFCILVVALAASAHPQSSSEPSGVKWTEVGKLIEEIFTLTKETLHVVVEDVKKVVPESGPKLEAYLASRAPKTMAFIMNIRKEILNRTLTKEKAREYFTQFTTRLNQLRGEIREGLFLDFKLPQLDVFNINKKVDESFQRIAALGDSIDRLF